MSASPIRSRPLPRRGRGFRARGLGGSPIQPQDTRCARQPSARRHHRSVRGTPAPSADGRSAWSAPHQPPHLSSENRGRGHQNENLKQHRRSPKVPEPAPEGRCRPQLAACQKTWWCVFIKFLPTLGFEKGQDAFSDADHCLRAQMRSRCARGRYVFLLMGRCVGTTPEFPNQPVRPIVAYEPSGGLVMVTKQLSIAIAIICIGSGLAWSDLQTFAAAPASETKIDFDQVFADATRQGNFNPSISRRPSPRRLEFHYDDNRTRFPIPCCWIRQPRG
jgi:hypothetical protein